jgi:hypothetical protein
MRSIDVPVERPVKLGREVKGAVSPLALAMN